MALLTRTQWEALYGTLGTEFPDNTTAEISEGDMRNFGQNASDSLFFKANDSYTAPFHSANASGVDTYAAMLNPAITAYGSGGLKVQIVFANANTGAATLNLNGLGAKPITKSGSTALDAGDISAGQAMFLFYDGTQFQIQGGGGGASIVTSWKNPVRVATTANGTLASDFENGDTVDGVTLATGNRILVKNQSSQSENGIYVVAASGAPSRSTDANSASELEGAAVMVQEGTSNANTTWIQTTDGITLGSSNIVWSQLGASVPVWTDTSVGTAERSTTAEAQNIITRTAAGSSDSSNSDARTPSEKGLVEMLLSFLGTAWTWALKQTFTTAPRFSSTTVTTFLGVDSNKDLVSRAEATQSDMLTGTSQTTVVTPKGVEDLGSDKSTTVSNGATGTTNIDCGLKRRVHIIFTVTVTGNITITLSNDTNLEYLLVYIPITGSNIDITVPSSFKMARSNEVASGNGWYQATPKLQVSSIGTADVHTLSAARSSTSPTYELLYGGAKRA